MTLLLILLALFAFPAAALCIVGLITLTRWMDKFL